MVGGGAGACMVGAVEDAGGMVLGVVGRAVIGGGADITVRTGVREIGTVVTVAGVVVGGAVVVVVVVGALVDGVGAAVAALRPYELGAEPPTASATPPAVNAAAATAAATMMCLFCMGESFESVTWTGTGRFCTEVRPRRRNGSTPKRFLLTVRA